MRWVKSIGVMLEERNTAQVSINMTNYTKTPIYRVYETVRFEAARYGVQIIGSELIGIVPMDALVETGGVLPQAGKLRQGQPGHGEAPAVKFFPHPNPKGESTLWLPC